VKQPCDSNDTNSKSNNNSNSNRNNNTKKRKCIPTDTTDWEEPNDLDRSIRLPTSAAAAAVVVVGMKPMQMDESNTAVEVGMSSSEPMHATAHEMTAAADVVDRRTTVTATTTHPNTNTSSIGSTTNGDTDMNTNTNTNTNLFGTTTDVMTNSNSHTMNSHPPPANTNNNHNNNHTNNHTRSNDDTNTNAYTSLRWMTVTNDGTSTAMIKLIGLKSLFAKQLPKMPRSYIARLVLDRNHTSLAILMPPPPQQPPPQQPPSQEEQQPPPSTTTNDPPNNPNHTNHNGSSSNKNNNINSNNIPTTTSVIGSDDEIIGGICYRTFQSQRFAEIAFCAVNASHQVKGYGTKLMNLLKQTAAQQGIEYFITYADNYAIGYFKKQGFTKQITMPKGRYYGLIKDYDGGTPMECYIHPSIDYFHVPALITAQRNFLLHRIARTAVSITTTYPPLSTDFFHGTTSTGTGTSTTSSALLQQQQQLQLQQQQQQLTNDIIGNSNGGGGGPMVSISRSNSIAAKAMTIPGIIEAGWTLSDLIQSTNRSDDMKQKSHVLKQELLAIIRKIEEQQFAWPFREPVDPNDAPDYFDVVHNPIDLKTITQRIKQDNHYKNKHMLYVDLLLMVNNCKLYNEDGSIYIQCAVGLEKYLATLFHDTLMVAMTTTTSSMSASSVPPMTTTTTSTLGVTTN
jgi:histone acetyltransferase